MMQPRGHRSGFMPRDPPSSQQSSPRAGLLTGTWRSLGNVWDAACGGLRFFDYLFGLQSAPIDIERLRIQMPKSTSVVLWTPYVSCTMPTHEYLLTQPWSFTFLPQFHVQVKSIIPTFTPVRPLLLPLMHLHQMVQPWINLSTAYLMSLSSLTLLTLAVYDLVEQFSLIPKLLIPTTPLSSSLPAAFQTIFPEHSSHFATAS